MRDFVELLDLGHWRGLLSLDVSDLWLIAAGCTVEVDWFLVVGNISLVAKHRAHRAGLVEPEDPANTRTIQEPELVNNLESVPYIFQGDLAMSELAARFLKELLG